VGRLTSGPVVEIDARVRETLLLDANVTGVEVVGSRATGTANALSDWDLRIEAHDVDGLISGLPSLVEPLEPLAAQWDRLSEPLGEDGAPGSVADAVDRYLRRRTFVEQEMGVVVDRRLGDEVLTRLREEHLVRG
jgi:hypothetical protein